MKRYAVITGASSGIGSEFARVLSQKGYSLILIARREERLIELSHTCSCECQIMKADLSKEEECYRIFDALKDYSIDLLINNAGFGDCGCFIDGDIQKEMDMIKVNIEAVHILTKLFIQKMNEQGYGSILNVASCAGLMPAGPYMSTYYATKAYVTSLTRGIAQELKEKKSPLYIGCLCPGPVDTEFNQVAQVKFALKGISVKQCVEQALKGMKKRKIVIIPSLMMRIMMTLGRFIPVSLYVFIASFQQKRKIYE